MLNPDRLAKTFQWLVSIDSISLEEGAVSAALQEYLKPLGAEIFVDGAGAKIGGQTGNLLAKFKGNREVPPMMLNAHMDTVEPGRGIVPIFRDGVFTGSGDTILGADDKSAVAILLEVMTVIHEENLPHGPIELLLTVAEEIGLLGAKHLDYALMDAEFGFALDTYDTDGVVTRAPASNHLEIQVHGKDAHAGAAPEAGINAIHLAAKALARIPMGRIDHETTCNIGLIEGGIATNIVPNLVTLKGEVRSHDEGKLEAVTRSIREAFEAVVAEYVPASAEAGKPFLTFQVDPGFPRHPYPRRPSRDCNRQESSPESGAGAFQQNDRGRG